MTETSTPAEQRAALQRQIDELDLSTYQAIKAAFDAVGAQNLKGNLAALFDASDATARQRSATSDPNALLSNALSALENVPSIAQSKIDQLTAKLAEPEVDEPGEPEAA